MVVGTAEKGRERYFFLLGIIEFLTFQHLELVAMFQGMKPYKPPKRAIILTCISSL
jgi:hypothetical protein